MNHEIHDMPDGEGAMITLEGEQIGFVVKQANPDDPSDIAWTAHHPSGAVYKDEATREPVTFTGKELAAEFVVGIHNQLKSMQTFTRGGGA